MSLKVIELLASSTISWEDATQKRLPKLPIVEERKVGYVKNQSALYLMVKYPNTDYRKVTFELE
jgi:hypothetical protein